MTFLGIISFAAAGFAAGFTFGTWRAYEIAEKTAKDYAKSEYYRGYNEATKALGRHP